MGTSLDESARENCEALYLSQESEFRSCFPIVSTDDFLTACMKSKADYCKIAKAYHFTCHCVKRRGFTCVTRSCKNGETYYQDGEQWFASGSHSVCSCQCPSSPDEACVSRCQIRRKP